MSDGKEGTWGEPAKQLPPRAGTRPLAGDILGFLPTYFQQGVSYPVRRPLHSLAGQCQHTRLLEVLWQSFMSCPSIMRARQFRAATHRPKQKNRAHITDPRDPQASCNYRPECQDKGQPTGLLTEKQANNQVGIDVLNSISSPRKQRLE